MIPILDRLARLQAKKNSRLVGVRALFLYPLNALINSQRDRLRAWTHAFRGDIRFCLYKGNTPEKIREQNAGKTRAARLSATHPGHQRHHVGIHAGEDRGPAHPGAV
ncbi:MAG: hypothetical protein ACREYF_06355 [Gammaproteobacteria bacterium]